MARSPHPVTTRTARVAAAFPELGVGFAGVALAFGITQRTMGCMFRQISGSHINPAAFLCEVVMTMFFHPIDEQTRGGSYRSVRGEKSARA